MFMDSQHRLIAFERLFSGTVDGASVYPRVVVRRCLELNAAALIFTHNHPSGMTTPSQADISITRDPQGTLNRQFDVAQPDQTYVGDITYLWTQEGWLYLAVVIDLYSRKVVGWSMGSRMKAQLVCDALTMAIWLRRPKAGLVVHSDRGSQYASKTYRQLLKAHGFTGSMSRKGDCWDNAVAESFFGSLKQERVQWRYYQTRHGAQQDVLHYISMFYNSYRLHSYLGYVSPNQYEAEAAELKKVA